MILIQTSLADFRFSNLPFLKFKKKSGVDFLGKNLKEKVFVPHDPSVKDNFETALGTKQKREDI